MLENTFLEDWDEIETKMAKKVICCLKVALIRSLSVFIQKVNLNIIIYFNQETMIYLIFSCLKIVIYLNLLING